jgi:hypothetical protein
LVFNQSVELTTSTSIVEKSTGNIISKTQTTPSKPLLLPGHTSPSEIQEKRPSESKLVSLKHQQFSTSIEMIPEQCIVLKYFIYILQNNLCFA